MNIRKLFEGTGAKLPLHLSDLDITSISANSKDVKDGCLFVAIKGAKFDGHNFVKEVFCKGAALAVVERKVGLFGKGNLILVQDTAEVLSTLARNFYGSPSDKIKLTGITGTNGKTTTAFLVESIMNESDIPCGLIGTIEYKVGKASIPAVRTTPDVLTVNALLDRMLKNNLKSAVMEVSSHALDQGRVRGIFFDAAIFTNITHEHLDYHGDIERYFKTKMKLFSNLKKNGTAIFNADDKKAYRINKALKCAKLSYGLDKPADIKADVKRIASEGSSFSVKIHNKNAFSVNTELVGRHNISNILAAVSAGVAQGIDIGAIKKGVEKVEMICGRLEPVKMGQDFKIFVDFAHTHDALKRTLIFLNGIKKRNIITVFGCGGERDKTKRPIMGRVTQKFSDFVVVTSDNPRGEDPKKIAKDIENGMSKKRCGYDIIIDRTKAIEKALKIAKKDDIVLLAGKGHETVQVVGAREIPFNDKKAAECILKSKIKIQSR